MRFFLRKCWSSAMFKACVVDKIIFVDADQVRENNII